jgi:hypothetical protein
MGPALLVAFIVLCFFLGGGEGVGEGGSVLLFLERAASKIQLKVRGSFSVIRIAML